MIHLTTFQKYEFIQGALCQKILDIITSSYFSDIENHPPTQFLPQNGNFSLQNDNFCLKNGNFDIKIDKFDKKKEHNCLKIENLKKK